MMMSNEEILKYIDLDFQEMVEDVLSMRLEETKPSDEFVRLRELLDDAGIEWHDASEIYDYTPYGGPSLYIYRTHGCGFSCIQSENSYGGRCGLLELWLYDSEPQGWLTAEEAFCEIRNRLSKSMSNL